MNPLRTHRWGAWLALVLFVLQGALPAFGSLGAWVCPDNRPCPYMNKGAASSDRADESGDPCAIAMQKKSCCRCPSEQRSSIEVPQECRFVSVRYQEPRSLVPPSPDFQKHTAPMVPPSAFDELLAALAAHRPEFPLPVHSPLPPPVPYDSTASRAPPLR